MDASNDRDENLISAILFVAIGTAAMIIATDYPIGSLRRMGPGLFPLLLGGLLTAVGIGLAVQSLLRFSLPWSFLGLPALATLRAMFFVMLALAAFAVLIRPAGLFPATAIMVFISTRAEPGHGIVSALVLSFVLAVTTALIFVYGIGLPIRLWP
ncbi:MAG: tripartite tricarboxylate transporter TctB family protein [Pseudolabrys sp.]|nr:tripartite tricarboxylate transporter TctB family protein [Pseudolabrys sp.]